MDSFLNSCVDIHSKHFCSYSFPYSLHFLQVEKHGTYFSFCKKNPSGSL